ncbi:MAG: putative membrane protein [Candidatus Woesearchaeota archaeon]|jgi:uncharacterized membrane protein
MSKKDWLQQESNDWVSDKVITKKQQETILAKYPEGNNATIFSIIGAVLVSIGILVFIASNWSSTPQLFKLILLVIITGTFYLGGNKLQARFPNTGSAVFMMGSIATGISIFLVAQMYHVRANADWLLLLWLVAIIPITYVYKHRPSLFVSIGVLVAWIIAQAETESLGALLFLGLFLYGISLVHKKEYESFSYPLEITGFILTHLILLITIFAELDVIDELGTNWLGYLILIIAAILLGVRIAKKKDFGWGVLSFVLAAIVLIISFLNITNPPTVIVVLFNIAFVILTIVAMTTGYKLARPAYVNIGIIFFLFEIMYLYFTRIFSYFPKSIGFIIGGIILLALGLFIEKKRKQLTKGMVNE